MNTADPLAPGVVVGTDGTTSSLDAVAWAATEAESRGEPLFVVHAFSWPLVRVPAAFASMASPGALRAQAEELLDQAVRVAREAAPGLRVESRLTEAFPVPLLLDESESATAVVVGSRGWGRIGGLLAGSTANALAAQAACPVVVVRRLPASRAPDAPVVVGLDGSEVSERALAAAVGLAVRRGRRLVAVTVQRSSEPEPALLRDTVAPWRERHPELTIEERALQGHVAGTLVALSAEAFAVVVGSHGSGGFRGMLLGSVSQALLHQGECPVIVVPRSSRTPAPPSPGATTRAPSSR